MADPDNSALDNARKRARRRLVGAVVLALAAAVVLPMFLESDPKPLGPDVQIQIPAIDDAKFQNRLTPAGASTAPAVDLPPAASEALKGQRETTDTAASAAPATTAAAAERAVSRTVPQALAPEAASRPGETKSAEPAPAQATPPAATPAPAPKPKPAPAAKPAVAQGGFVVQLGAFVDSTVARDLAAKAGEQGFPAFLEAVTTKGGQVQRVRIGPFATRGEADAAAAKLKGAGFTAVARPR